MLKPVFSKKAKGKYLLTAEYFILDGAVGLALPLRFGQNLHFFTQPTGDFLLHWISLDENRKSWFEAFFQPDTFEILQSSDSKTAQILQNLLKQAFAGKSHLLFVQSTEHQTKLDEFSDFYRSIAGILAHCKSRFCVVTDLNFSRNWGLGTSSTLVSLVAQWSNANPYELLSNTFGGSGYDIACATASKPILYQLKNGIPVVSQVHYHPPFAEHIFFIYLGKKQDSREGIARYRTIRKKKFLPILEISALTQGLLLADSIQDLERIIKQHEEIIGNFIELPTAKTRYFADFPGEIKSLGAWGGDFVMAVSELYPEKIIQYFNQKAFRVVLPFSTVIAGE